MLKVSLLFQAIERVTAPVRRIRSSIRGMAREGERDVGRLGRVMGRLGGIARAAGARIHAGLRRGFAGIVALAQRTGRAVGRALGRGAKFGAAAGVAGITYLLWQLTGGVIETTSQFEQFQVVLENTEGSVAGARRAMAWVRRFAETTPFEVADVMEAFVRLRAYGIDPTNGSLRSLGNAASGMNKSIMDAVEMLADAQTGEFERLKEFGIRATVAGNNVRLTYMRNGREMTRSVRKNATEIQRAITGIFDERFGGMMQRQSGTMAGLMSNLKDQWTSFQLAIGRAGIFDLVKSKLEQLLARVNDLANNGTLQRWAQRVSGTMERVFTGIWNFLQNTDWAAVGRDIGNVAREIWNMARALADLAAKARNILGIVQPLANATPTGMLQTLMSGRIGVGITIPRGVARAFGILSPEERAQRDARQRAAAAEAARVARALAARRVNLAAPLPGMRAGRPTGVFDNSFRFGPSSGSDQPSGIFPRNGFTPLRRGAPIRQQGGRPQEVRVRNQVGGRIDLGVTMSPELRGRLDRIESRNREVPIIVSRGLALMGFPG